MAIFEKKNTSCFSDILNCEVKGIQAISSGFGTHHNLHTPKIYSFNQQIIEMEKIYVDKIEEYSFHQFGQELANMHLNMTTKNFGLDYDNYIGMNPQKNDTHHSWSEFFLENRILFQIRLIRDKGVQLEFEKLISHHKKKIIELLECHGPTPSLLHGESMVWQLPH